MKIKKIIFFGAIFSIFLLSQPLTASVLVSPVRFEVNISPGKSYADAIRVRNMKDADINVKVYVSDFSLNEEGSISFHDEGTLENSISNCIRVNPTLFKLKPQEEKWVRFTVRMPENIDGELFGMIFFQSIPKGMEEASGKQVFISTRIGAVVYASPKGKVQKIAEISDFYLKENAIESSIEYSIVFHNKGNIHVRPKGELRVLDSHGKKLVSAQLNEQGAPILRENLRVFTGKIGENLKQGNFRVTAELDYGGKENIEVEKSINILPDVKVEEFKAKFLSSSEVKQSPGDEINDIKIKKLEGMTLLSILSNGPLNYSSFELESPPRLVIDLKRVENKIFPREIQINSNQAKRVRTSQFQLYPEKTSRIVIDLISKQKYEIISDIEGLKILIGNTELLRKELSGFEISGKPKIVFIAKAEGVNLEKVSAQSFIRVKNLKGKVLAQIPLKIKSSKKLTELEAEWGEIPEPGIYFAELILIYKKTPILSYAKFVVEK